MPNEIYYPDIHVKLIDGDGNAFAVLGKMFKALKNAGVPQDEIHKFKLEAMAGNYDHLLQTCMKWVTVE